MLRIHDIFVDDESGAFRVVGNALADLAVRGVSTVVVEEHPHEDLDVPDRSKLSKEVEEFLRSNGVATTGQRQLRLFGGNRMLLSTEGVPQVLDEQSAI